MSQYALIALGLWLLTVLVALGVLLLTRSAREADARSPGREVPALGRWLRHVFAADPAGARRAAAVAAHARWLGSVLGLTRVEHGHVYLAALLHGVESLDVDTLAWEQEDEEVRALAASYAARGVHMLRDVHGLEPAARIAMACREHMDGSGYPRGLAGDAIPHGARIIAVAEAYVDLLHGRAATDEPLPPAAALEQLACRRGHELDPALVDAFSSHVSHAMIDVTWSAQDTAWLMSPRGGPAQR
jgi:HD-GYP domain-containing protein (c-di-GMP phosphodiesterase class II)